MPFLLEILFKQHERAFMPDFVIYKSVMNPFKIDGIVGEGDNVSRKGSEELLKYFGVGKSVLICGPRCEKVWKRTRFQRFNLDELPALDLFRLVFCPLYF